jgi:hypothetical protein
MVVSNLLSKIAVSGWQLAVSFGPDFGGSEGPSELTAKSQPLKTRVPILVVASPLWYVRRREWEAKCKL